MKCNCPICGSHNEGVIVTGKDSSILKSLYKMYYSLLVPIPFIGTYIGGKVFDVINSISSNVYKYVCPNCKCIWTNSIDAADLKFIGNKKLMSLFFHDTFVIGIIEKDMYMIQVQENSNRKVTVFFSENGSIASHNYINGKSNSCNLCFGDRVISTGVYKGELLNNHPNGWGVLYAKNGFVYYGKWSNGYKDGVFVSCSPDSKTNNVEYWKNGVLVNI